MIPGGYTERSWGRAAAVVVLAVVVHEAVLPGLRIDGVRPDLLLGVGVAAALVAGPDRGAVVAFAAGAAGDLFVDTPFGLSALVACVVAFLAGTVAAAMGPSQRWAIPVLTSAASAAAEVCWAILATVLGLPGLLHPHLLVVALVVAVVNGAVSMPVAGAMRWAFGGEGASRAVELAR